MRNPGYDLVLGRCGLGRKNAVMDGKVVGGRGLLCGGEGHSAKRHKAHAAHGISGRDAQFSQLSASFLQLLDLADICMVIYSISCVRIPMNQPAQFTIVMGVSGAHSPPPFERREHLFRIYKQQCCSTLAELSRAHAAGPA
jgi:hypothetical protein